MLVFSLSLEDSPVLRFSTKSSPESARGYTGTDRAFVEGFFALGTVKKEKGVPH